MQARASRQIAGVRNEFCLKFMCNKPYIRFMDTDFAQLNDDALNTGADWLARAGVRPTRQRLSLAGLLVGDGHDRHVTAESLFLAVKESGESVSLATVYNTLRAFCDAGLMNEITVDATRSYFDTCVDEHPHYFWEDSQQLTDAPSGEVAFSRLPSAPEGAEISRVDVVIRLRRK